MVQPGEERIAPADVDDAFDLRMALELGAAQMTIGRLSSEQLISFRQLAEATAPYVAGKRFTDLPRYIAANHAFHMFTIEASKNAQLIALYGQLRVSYFINRALTADIEIVGDIVQQHIHAGRVAAAEVLARVADLLEGGERLRRMSAGTETPQ